ncbi:MAG: glutaredoxin domain-containing protein [Tistlia sp.]|uniref:glutaredoxin domain-containing protein n=1 Tax=Tistlia sp. TaxID=3057121 RepID=UPI0034A3B274
MTTQRPETERQAPVRVFWAPGCSSCLRTKEFLKKRGIAFVSVNVKDDTGAREQLLALGARSVPIVARGERFVYAQSNADIVGFLGLEETAAEMLPPAVLVERLDRVLHAAARYLKQVPEAELDVVFNDFFAPRALAQHAFRVAEAFVEATETGEDYTYERMMRGTHDVGPGDDILGYGASVIAALDAWWQHCPDRSCSAPLRAYWGVQSRHELLERAAWHSAQHTRQLQSIVEHFGGLPDGPLGERELAGLPLPDSVWMEASADA